MRDIIIRLNSSWRSSASIRLLSALMLVVVLLFATIIYASVSSKQPIGQTFAQIDFLAKPTGEIKNQSNTPAEQENSQETKSSSGAPKYSRTATQNATTNSSQSSSSEDSSETSPEADTGESLTATVAFYGDSQSDTDTEDTNHVITVNSILSSGANPVFHLGDLMEDGTQDSLNRFNSVTSTLRSQRTFYSALGNNDRKIGDSATPSPLYLDNFQFPGNEKWYSVNVGNLHVVVLDSAFSSRSVGSEQYDWLSGDLQSQASQSRITVVIFHHPPYGLGGDSKGLITTFVPLFRDLGVDFVISGHEHTYQKATVDGIPYFISSGQPAIGYYLARVYQSYATLTYYSAAGGLIDSINIPAR